ASVVTTLVAPPIMAFTFLLPAFAQKYFTGIAPVLSPFLAIVGSLLALIVPLAIFSWCYQRSSAVFGRLDDVSGKFDIGRMPPVSVDEIKQDVKVTNRSTLSAIVA